MPREDISFRTSDAITLRGWFYTPQSTHSNITTSSPSTTKLPCLVMAHGFTALKEMSLDTFAEYFVSKLPITCLVYDNRGFGASDNAPHAPRSEIIPAEQISDYKDAVTYAQTRPEVDQGRVGIWGSSYSGGHVLWVGAVDRRVKCVLSQVPLVDGWANFQRLIRSDFWGTMDAGFQADRLARMEGKEAMKIPVVDENPLAQSALPTADSYKFFSAWEKKSDWKNEVTLRSAEALREYLPAAHIEHISPTPLLLTVAENDVLTPTDLALGVYERARQPKQLQILPGGHFDAYDPPNFETNAAVQAEFLKKYLCK